MKDELGDRIKSQYEDRTRYYLPRRTYTIIRLDGKAFHTYTRGLNKPFDKELYEDMDNAIVAMMTEIQGVRFAYTQSDEISLLLTDFALPTSSAWFDGNLQKMVSVSASIITAEFNKRRWIRNAFYFSRTEGCMTWPKPNDGDDKEKHLPFVPTQAMVEKTAYFDGRAFTIPDRIEVMNYFIHRNQDCARNSVSMVAQHSFSHKKLQGKSTSQMQEMLMTEADVNWSYYPDDLKNGRLIVKEEYVVPCPPEFHRAGCGGPDVTRSRWVSTPAWKFTQDKERLLTMIPKAEQELHE